MSEKIYNGSPVFIQNIMVSLVGANLYRKRYFGQLKKISSEILKFQNASLEEIDAYQAGQLKKMLVYCSENIPYYRSLFRKYHININKIEKLKHLEDIPILEKETLKNNIHSFYPQDGQKRTYMVQKTSGSTGTPLAIHVDRYTYQLAMALLVQHEELHGIRLRERRATFAGRMIQDVDKNTPPFWRMNFAENQMIFSAYHINPDSTPFYVNELNRFRPKEIIGYPSAIYSLAKFCVSLGLGFTFTPKAIITNSETLFDWQREVIERVFKCDIFDYYGSAEYVVFAGQCKEKKYHINPLIGVLEIVNELGKPVVNEIGAITCTTLTNYAMPLIRYKVGDMAVNENTDCSCGSHTGLLGSVEGRKDDMVLTADGKKIGRLDHVFKGVYATVECQIVQNSINEFTLKIVREKTFLEKDKELIISNMKQRIGNQIHVKVEYPDKLERTSRGKFKGVISEIDKG